MAVPSSNYQDLADELESHLRKRDLGVVCRRSGAQTLGVDHLSLVYLGTLCEFSVRRGLRSLGRLPLAIADRIIVAGYLLRADGRVLTDHWVSIRSLESGKVYDSAFAKRVLDPLARLLEGPDTLLDRAARLGGSPEARDRFRAAVRIPALPRIPVLVAYGEGEEGGPSRANLLFDASANGYLETEALAVLGAEVARRLVSVPES